MSMQVMDESRHVHADDENTRLIFSKNPVSPLRMMSKTRWYELFGTPEKTARTLYYDKQPICVGCALLDECDKMPDGEQDTCLLINHDALLEWLKGDAE